MRQPLELQLASVSLPTTLHRVVLCEIQSERPVQLGFEREARPKTQGANEGTGAHAFPQEADRLPLAGLELLVA